LNFSYKPDKLKYLSNFATMLK